LSILAEAVRFPRFPEARIARLKTQLLTGLQLRAQDTGDMASMLFDDIVYAGHPYRRPEDGYPETVDAITAADLLEFHRAAYGPRGMVLAIVGAIAPAAVIAMVEEVFGDWEAFEQTSPPALPPVTPLEETVFRRHEIPGKSQADLILGVAGPPRKSEDYLPAALGNSVLGQFGMYGRIGRVVREQSGLAYYAYSSLGGGIGPGPWSVNAGIAPENVELAFDLIKKEIEKFVAEPVTDEELEDTKANYIGRLPLALESNNGVAGALINLERYGLPMDYYLRYAESIRAYTPEDVLAASRRYLEPDRLAVGVAGSFAESDE
jgi:zinc protease